MGINGHLWLEDELCGYVKKSIFYLASAFTNNLSIGN